MKKWVIGVIIGIIALVVVLLFFSYKRGDYCFSSIQCKPYYSCCGGWMCIKEGQVFADCAMMCEKPLDDAGVICSCDFGTCERIILEE